MTGIAQTGALFLNLYIMCAFHAQFNEIIIIRRIRIVTLHGHPRSIIFVSIESVYARDFLLVINSNLGPVFHRF